MGIEIKDLPPAAAALAIHIIAAQTAAGVTSGLTLAQVSDLVIARLTDSAPAALDAWLELVAQIEDNEDGIAALVAAIALKADAADTEIHDLTDKTTPVDADEFRISDSAAAFAFKKLTLANLWTWVRGKVLTLFNAAGLAPVYACRAWVAFTDTGTVAILGSGNVASVVRISTGVYEITMTTALADANYGVIATPRDGGYMAGQYASPKTTTVFRVSATTDAGALSNASVMNVMVIR